MKASEVFTPQLFIMVQSSFPQHTTRLRALDKDVFTSEPMIWKWYRDFMEDFCSHLPASSSFTANEQSQYDEAANTGTLKEWVHSWWDKQFLFHPHPYSTIVNPLEPHQINIISGAFERGIDNDFVYHSPKPGQPEIYTDIRDTARAFATKLTALVPSSKELEQALARLNESVMWANAGIARNSK